MVYFFCIFEAIKIFKEVYKNMINEQHRGSHYNATYICGLYKMLCYTVYVIV